jgi:TRAP-type C4-dicarboxylate transport system substrate-binding protein
MKFNEVQKFYSLTGHVQGILAYVINANFYNGLPADLQKIVADGATTYLVKRQRQLEVDDTSVFLKKLADGGMKINEITPANHQKFVDALKPMYVKFAKDNGQDILDAIAKYNK